MLRNEYKTRKLSTLETAYIEIYQAGATVTCLCGKTGKIDLFFTMIQIGITKENILSRPEKWVIFKPYFTFSKLYSHNEICVYNQKMSRNNSKKAIHLYF